MASLPFPSREEQWQCAWCHDSGWLLSPFPADPFDYIPCPCCHQDCSWTIADACDDGTNLMDVAYSLDGGEQEGGRPCDC